LYEEVAQITYQYSGVTLTEAWSLSYQERVILVEELKKINDAQIKSQTGKTIIRN